MALRAQATQEVFVGTDDADELTGALSDFFRVPVTPREFILPGRTRIAVDFADGGDPPSVLIQRSPLRGQLKSAQRNKAIADAFKLSWLRDQHFPSAYTFVLLGSPFARMFAQGTWLTEAFAAYRISVLLANKQRNINLLDTLSLP